MNAGTEGLRSQWLSGGVLLPAMREGETFAFSMCNPPFFGTESEAKQGKVTESPLILLVPLKTG